MCDTNTEDCEKALQLIEQQRKIKIFDLTVNNLKAKAAQERSFIEETYNKIVEDQKKMMIGFEMKQTNMVRNRISRIESFVENLAFEQSKLVS